MKLCPGKLCVCHVCACADTDKTEIRHREAQQRGTDRHRTDRHRCVCAHAIRMSMFPCNLGDEIRPMVRTMVNRVYRVVVFLSPAYISSPNCCVELMEAAQHPEKLVVCILKDCDPAVYDYLDTLKAKGAKICFGMKE